MSAGDFPSLSQSSLQRSPQRPVVSVVLGSYNRLAFLKPTLQTIREELTRIPGEIIVVDGGSTDGTVPWLCRQKDVITVLQHNRGTWQGQPIERRSWGYFMNLGFRSAQGRFICMVSDDCLVVPNALVNGCRFFEEQLDAGHKVGAVAFWWRNWPEQQDYWVGQTRGDKVFVNHGLYAKEALEAVGYIDEDPYRFYYADSDLCLKMWHAGYEVKIAPNSYIEHFNYANLPVRAVNNSTAKADQQCFEAKWGDIYAPATQDWCYQAYQDPHQTAEHYYRPFYRQHRLKKLLTGCFKRR